MLFYILLVLTVIVSGFITWHFCDDMFDSILGRIVATPLVFAAAAFCIGIFCALIYWPLGFWADNWEHPSNTTSYELKAINASNNTRGQFWLGSGYINEEAVYTYYYKNDDGSFKMERIDADNAVIVEDDTVTPHVERTGWDQPWWYGPCDMIETYVIYVPEGSVTSDINLNLPE